MAKRKVFATLPNGKKVSRQTDRTYTHVVINLGLRAEHLQTSREESREYRRKDVAQYRKIVESGIVPAGWGSQTIDNYREYLSHAEAAFANVDADYDQREAKNAKVIADQEYDVVGWCGREDLARKLRLKEISAGRLANVQVVPVDAE